MFAEMRVKKGVICVVSPADGLADMTKLGNVPFQHWQLSQASNRKSFHAAVKIRSL
jgi:hypothetical protein